MSHSLQRLLNPDKQPESDSHTAQSSDVSHHESDRSSHSSPRLPVARIGKSLVIPPRNHQAHAQCPDHLNCLPNTDGKPQHTLPVILRCAILGSPKQRLTIREIYAAMEGKYPYYLSAGTTWKQSVRHHLSLNRLFERQPRPEADPGFGSYWTVNLLAPPGTKRPRKRGRPSKTPQSISSDPNTFISRPRGRPRKETNPRAKLYSPPVMDDDEDAEIEFTQPPTDDEYDSDEIMEPVRYGDQHDIYPTSFVRLPSLPPTMPIPSPLPLRAPTPEIEDELATPIQRLQRELDSNRRKSDETIARLTSQLVHVQQEATRLREELNRAEDQLEMESLRRRDAEYSAVGETGLRRDAEEALTTLQDRWRASMRDDS